jgi:hypothetical protein
VRCHRFLPPPLSTRLQNWFVWARKRADAADPMLSSPTGRASCSRSTAPRATWLSCRQTLGRRLTYRSRSSQCGAQEGKPLVDLSIPESYRWVPPRGAGGVSFRRPGGAQIVIFLCQKSCKPIGTCGSPTRGAPKLSSGCEILRKRACMSIMDLPILV